MALTSSSKAFLRIGSYVYPTTDLYGQEIPFSSLATSAFGPSAFGTNHSMALGWPRWDDIHVDAGGGGSSTFAYPIGG